MVASASTVENAVVEVQAGLMGGRFVNEAAVSTGVVLRLLSALGWDTYDPGIVAPEFTLQGRRVDFALCHPAGKPVAFIEVKKVGQGADAERQLFEYAFFQGVQLAVLTTGQEWHFFLPGEAGSYEERRVYKLDLLERDAVESAERLHLYLRREDVVSGKAIREARAEYAGLARIREAQRNLPIAWKTLINDQDELLMELLSEKTETLCGFRPDPEIVSGFLQSLTGATQQGSDLSGRQKAKPVTPPINQKDPVPPLPIESGPIRFTLFGVAHTAKTYRQLMITVVTEFQRRDSTFFERFNQRMGNGQRRPVIAGSPEALFPKNPSLAMTKGTWVELAVGWYIDTNQSKVSILKNLERACEVAGVRFGTELSIT